MNMYQKHCAFKLELEKGLANLVEFRHYPQMLTWQLVSVASFLATIVDRGDRIRMLASL
jgi:hypothetical protein